ncbi:MAG: hypothetical protein VKS61_01035 [Candidatus Sericytochromatia bacterium]|nr:hypothetical protein [Candidatus Sericytochromatia bacterium]
MSVARPRGVVVKKVLPEPGRLAFLGRWRAAVGAALAGLGASLGRLGLVAFVWLSALAAWVPLAPRLPSAARATAWQLAANEGVARGLVFGQDLVLTVGPFAAAFSHLYHPATDLLALVGGLLLAAGTAAPLLALTEGVALASAVPLCLLVTGLVAGRDALLLALPLLVGLLGHRLSLTRGQPAALAPTPGRQLAFAVGCLVLWLLPLVKLWTLPLVLGVSVCLVAHLAQVRRRGLAAAVLLGPGALPVLWGVAGQPLDALPDYLLTAWRVMAGYATGMAVSGPAGEIAVYLGVGALLLTTARRTVPEAKDARLFLTLAYGLTLAVGLKAGFVRHDDHALVAAALLLVLAATLPMLGARAVAVPVLASVLGWAYVEHRHTPTTTRSLVQGWGERYGGLYAGLQARGRGPAQLHDDYSRALAALQGPRPSEVGDRSRDGYPSEPQTLIGPAGTWKPRPMLFGPGVYDAAFARANAAHLESARAPQYLRYALAPRDGHLPSAEDGPTWPVLLRQYVVAQADERQLWLRRRAALEAPYEHVVLLESYCALGETIEVPPGAVGPVVAQFDLRPTDVGRFLQVAFKPTALELQLELEDGVTAAYRLTAGQAEGSFVLSPLIEDVGELSALFDWETRPQPLRRVKRLTLASLGPFPGAWDPDYRLRLTALRPAAATFSGRERGGDGTRPRGGV